MMGWNPLHSPAAPQGLRGVGKEHMQAWQTLCGLSLRHEPVAQEEVTLAIHRSQRNSLFTAVFWGPKKPMSAHIPFSEHKEVPSRLVAPKEFRDDMVWDTNS